MSLRHLHHIALTSSVVAFAACTPTPTASARSTSTLPPRVISTSTSAPARRGTSAPTASSLSSTGPWVVSITEQGLWVSNADASARTQIAQTEHSDIHYSLSPDGRTLAFVLTPSEPSNAMDAPDASLSGDDFSLFLVTFPSTAPTKATSLISRSQLEAISTQYPSPNDTASFRDSSQYRILQLAAAIRDQGSLSWSPSGDSLAFVAALDGPSTDVYELEVEPGTIHRLSFGPFEAANLLWSPDSRHIVHNAISDFNVGRSGTGTTDSLWAAHGDGSLPTLLVDGPAFAMAWASPRLLLASLWLMQCDSYYLMLIDLETGAHMPLWRGPLWVERTDRLNFTFLVPPPSRDSNPLDPWLTEECPPPGNPPSAIDASQIPGLPLNAFTKSQTSSIRITVQDGSIQFAEVLPTETPTVQPTRQVLPP